MLKLGQTKVRADPAHNGRAAPHKPALARQVPARGVEHLRRQKDHGDLGHVVRGAAHTGAEGAQPHGGGLGDDGVRDGAHGGGKHERDDDAQAGLRVVGRLVLRDRGADAQQEEEGHVDGGAPEVDGAAAEPRGQEPGDAVADELQARVDEGELEGEVG